MEIERQDDRCGARGDRLGRVGVGIGNVFATTIATIGRNPSIQNRVAGLMWIGFALVEAIGLFAAGRVHGSVRLRSPGRRADPTIRRAAAQGEERAPCHSWTCRPSPARSSG